GESIESGPEGRSEFGFQILVCFLPCANCLLAVSAYCLLPTAYYQLPTTNCLLLSVLPQPPVPSPQPLSSQWLGWGPMSVGFAVGDGMGPAVFPCGVVPVMPMVEADSTFHPLPD